jgi:hypothetical protein
MLTSSLVFAGANTRTTGEAAVASALELSTLDLDGTQLVVLSACETGLGGVSAGEGVFGLRRAFAEAGARRLVVSLWKVDDDATAFLMGVFYQALKDGLDVDAALAHAQGETRRQPRWAHPYYWAAFILSGAHDGFRMASASVTPAKITAPDDSPPLKGKVLWTYLSGGGIQGAPAIDGAIVFVGSEDGEIHALNRTDGSRVWHFSTASKIFGQARAAAGRLFFGDHDGSVYAGRVAMCVATRPPATRNRSMQHSLA